MLLLLTPESIRARLCLKRVNSVFLSLSVISGLIEIPGKFESLRLLAKMFEASHERTSLASFFFASSIWFSFLCLE